ncbi:UNVERIFIED_CONTAM: hypothetical protein GTU68_002598 [Idotea baltica]|nr:hypothetical protein [Idotea baltica]
MGALHLGHLSLLETAKKENDVVVVSIFVNPTQFDNKNDLDNYPNTFKEDQQLLEAHKCDVLFAPSVNGIYENNIVSERFDFGGLDKEMEGKFRANHFNGVATIVKSLFEIVTPDNAYFGEKDFQQLQIIKKLTAICNFDVIIKGMPIFREKNGLAMSSRNERLSKIQKIAAPFIYRVLQYVQQHFSDKNFSEINQFVTNAFKNHSLLDLEYFVVANENTLKPVKKGESNKNYRAFIAVFAGEIRLIDNIAL